MQNGGRQPDGRSDAELVQVARSSEPDAFGVLFDRWFDRSWNVARNIVRQDELAAEVAQDAMLNAWQRLDQLHDVDAFGGWLLRITRNRALNRLERERRSRATDDDVVSGLRDRRAHEGQVDPVGAQTPPAVDALVDSRDQQQLVWAAAAALGERDASLLDLHLRHGLGPGEIAEELGVEANTAHQQLFRLRNKLGDAIGSLVLWRNGKPLCQGLAEAVSGQVAFDKSVSRAVARHQKSCDECSERRAVLLDPTKLFASVPLVAVPAQFKVQAASALQQAGVPVDPDVLGASTVPPSSPGSPKPPSQSSGSGPTVDDGFCLEAASRSSFDSAPAILSLPSKAALTKMVIAASALVIFGLLVVAMWRIGIPGVVGGEAVGSGEIVAGPAVVDQPGLSALLSDEDEAAGSTATSSAVEGSNRTETTLRPSTTTRVAPTIVNGIISSTVVDEDGSITSSTTAKAGTSSMPLLLEPTTTTDMPTSSTSSRVVSTTTSTTGSTTTSTDTSVSMARSSTTVRSSTTSTPTTSTSASSSTPDSPTTSPSTTTTSVVPLPPRIVRLQVRDTDYQLECQRTSQETFEVVWSTANASLVTLTVPDGSMTVKSTGSRMFCGISGHSVIMVASTDTMEDKAAATIP